MPETLTIDKPESKSQVPAQSQTEKRKRNLDSGLSLKSHGPPTPPPTFKHENKKTQRVKVTQYDPLYIPSTKNRWTAGGRTQMSPPCSRRTLSKQCFTIFCDSKDNKLKLKFQIHGLVPVDSSLVKLLQTKFLRIGLS